MNIKEFKLWFQGLLAGQPGGTGLTSLQLNALKEVIESLEDEDGNKASPVIVPEDPPKSGTPARTTPALDIDKILEEIKRGQEEKPNEKDIPSYPYPHWPHIHPWYPGPHWGDPMDPTKDYPFPGQIWCTTFNPSGH